MAAILQQLSGNPLSTAIGQKIEQATDPSLNSEDWALNMEICDMINDTDEGPKDAIRAIKKKLQMNAGKNHDVIMYTLIVLETCVKNCGKRFHILVTNKDFIQELIKIIGPKYDPPAALQEKILSLIQTWAETFRGQAEFGGVTQIYSELKQKGIEFPLPNLDSTAPIHTPQRSVPIVHQQQLHHNSNQVMSQAPGQAVNSATVVTNVSTNKPIPRVNRHITGPITLNSEQMMKLNSELEVVKGNMIVLDEMLNELTPGEEHKDDFELLSQVHDTCQAMQKRIVDLIEKVANEEITNELLRVNDELNTLFLRYERFIKRRSQGSKQDGKVDKEQEKSLIDLSAEDLCAGGAASVAVAATLPVTSTTTVNQTSITNQMSKISLNNKTTTSNTFTNNTNIGDVDFDMFAQIRSSTTSDKGKQITSQPPTSTLTEAELQNEEDFKEMEKWLKEQTPITAAITSASIAKQPQPPQQQQQQQQSADQARDNGSSTAFDKFLEGRVFVAESLPSKADQNNSKPKDPFGL